MAMVAVVAAADSCSGGARGVGESEEESEES